MSTTPQSMTDDIVWNLITPLKNKHWFERTRLKSVKTISDWSNLYRALCYVGLGHDNRYPGITRLDRLLLKKDFDATNEYTLSRGKCQAYSYRRNRIIENAETFFRIRARNPSYSGYEFVIEHFFPVLKMSGRYNSVQLGWVVATDSEDALRIADMLYTPFFPKNHPDNSRTVRIESDDKIPVLYGDRSQLVALMAKTSESIRKTRTKIQESIQKLKEQIDENILMEECLNLNLCAYDQDES
jgi:hypothetical protein